MLETHGPEGAERNERSERGPGPWIPPLSSMIAAMDETTEASMRMGLDPRHRRGSIGPPPAAQPLRHDASGTALHAHLVTLLDPSHDAVAPPSTMAADSMAADSMTTGPTTAGAMAAGSMTEIGEHEDLERQPDGIPHLVIGLTALVSVVFAAGMISILISGPTFGSVAAGALGLLAVPFAVFRLDARAEHDRDHDHPSR
jgi:hypothetical protein